MDEKYRVIPLEYINFSVEYEKLCKRVLSVQRDINNNMQVGDTLGDILDLDSGEFSRIHGVGVKYVRLLDRLTEEVASMTPLLDVAYAKYSSVNNINVSDDLTQLPMSVLSTSKEYMRLINKIATLNADGVSPLSIVETVSDVASININGFSEIKSVGRGYVATLKKLQEEISIRLGGSDEEDESRIDLKLFPYDFSQCFLNERHLSGDQVKLLNKLERMNKRISVAGLLSLSESRLLAANGFGKKQITIYREICAIIFSYLERVRAGQVAIDNSCDSLIVNSEYFDISLEELDRVLLDDVEQYLFSLSQKEQDIVLSRWGFHHDAETLSEVASRYDVSRERIRQLESKANQGLSSSIRIHPKILSQHIKENITIDLGAALPMLASSFKTPRLFYGFLEIMCQEQKNAILAIQEPKVPSHLLDQFFANNPPTNIEGVVAELTSNAGYSEALALSAIRVLRDKRQLKVNEGVVYPINMPRSESVAHVLSEHPNGLPWKDAIKLVNQRGCCRGDLDESRLMNHYFADAGYVYVCERGAYKHTKYFDSTIDVEEISKEISAYIDDKGVDSIHLNDFYHHANSVISSLDYFDVRHIVRTFGADYGLYFKGRSGVDAVGLSPNPERVTQQKLIISIMNSSERALTKHEIAERLRSKSMAHASFYLDKMMESGEVVRIDNMVYTTPEKAFSGIDVDEILCLMDDIVTGEERVIEADVFRLQINKELNLSYPKYFYMALANQYLDEFGWSKVYNLLANHDIPYSSLADAVSTLCDPDADSQENLKRLSLSVLITKHTAMSAFSAWKHQIRMG